MTKTVCIVGLGIGTLYVSVAKTLGYNIVTIDHNPTLNANYLSIDDLPSHLKFDMAIICLPNYLHESTAKKLVKYTDRIVVEKPGFESTKHWVDFQNSYGVKLFMVKNNMFRTDFYKSVSNIQILNEIESIKILWINKDRVPGAGSWFTNKELSYGGVSKDLIPHTLSVVQTLLSTPNIDSEYTALHEQMYSLSDITTNSWGTAKLNGVYNVDDQSYFSTKINNIDIECAATWKHDNISKDCVEWRVKFNSGLHITYVAGLCPEEAYVKMIDTYMNVTDSDYNDYMKYDVAIHNILDNFKNEPCRHLIDKIIHEN
jgi:hypothetical protein